MPRYYKYDDGDEMRKLLRQIRFNIYTINSHDDKEKYPYIVDLLNKLVMLKIIIDELIEDNVFKLVGKGNIVNDIKLLGKITLQATKWRNYTKRFHVKI